jgi:hypothetical protein
MGRHYGQGSQRRSSLCVAPRKKLRSSKKLPATKQAELGYLLRHHDDERNSRADEDLDGETFCGDYWRRSRQICISHHASTLESRRSASPESSRCLARTSTPSEKKDKGKKEQREPKLLLAMDPARRSQLKSKSPPHPHQEWQEEEEGRLQI